VAGRPGAMAWPELIAVAGYVLGTAGLVLSAHLDRMRCGSLPGSRRMRFLA
jgi:hypothetical protein